MRDLTSEHYAAIGRIALAAAGLDLVVQGLLQRLTGRTEAEVERLTDRLTGRAMLKRRDKAIDAAGLPEALQAYIVAFREKAGRAYIARNENLHAIWIAVSEGKVMRIRWSAVETRRGLELEMLVAETTPAHLELLARAIFELARFGSELGELLPPQSRIGSADET